MTIEYTPDQIARVEADLNDFPFDHCAAVVLDWAGQSGGYPGGGFVSKLLDAMGNADEFNMDRLAQGFPALAEAMRTYKRVSGGSDILRQAVDGRWTHPPVAPWASSVEQAR